MNYSQHLEPDRLERYSFLWSLVRLFVAAVSLLIGGIPVALKILPLPYGLLNSLLTIAWVISGLASGYLLYRWMKNNKQVFGGKDKKDLAAFFVLVVSGLNLGLTGLTSKNIGMSIFSSYLFWVIGGLIYIVAAVYLYNRWNAHGKKLF